MIFALLLVPACLLGLLLGMERLEAWMGAERVEPEAPATAVSPGGTP